MKINKIALLFLVLLLVPIASAWDFDNVKSYDPVAKEVTLKNAYGLGGDLAKVKLTANSDHCGSDCYAEGTIALYSPRALIDSVRFAGAIKGYNFFIADGTKTIKVDDYATECSPITYQNGTKSQICEEKLTGKHDVVLTNWVAYNGEELKTGTYQWRIEGTKRMQDNVDWIGKWFGVEVTEWAWWIAVAPTHYWKFNESSGNAVDSVGTLNLVNTNFVYIAGKLGNAINSSRNDDYFQASSTDGRFGTGNFTIAFWVNIPPVMDGAVITTQTNYGDAGTFELDMAYGDGKFSWKYGGSRVYITNTDIRNLGWKRIVIRRIDGNFTGFIDGVADTSIVHTNDFSGGDYIVIGKQNQADAGTQGNFRGGIDDLSIFKGYAWSNADIVADWNAGAGKELDTETAGISVTTTLISPIDYANLSVTTFSFVSNATVTAGNLTNATLYLTNATGTIKTNFTTIADLVQLSEKNLSLSGISEGTYNWNVEYCGVNASSTICTFASANRTISIDITPPTLTLVSPLTNSSVVGTSLPLNVSWSVTSSDTTLQACWYVNGATTVIYTCNSTQVLNFTTGGNKQVTFWANDSLGNSASATYDRSIYDFNYTQSGATAGAEGSTANFTLYVNSNSFSIGDASANLWYGGANKGATTKTVINASQILFTTNFAIPSGTGNSSGKPISWFWNFNTTYLSSRNTTTRTQSVYNMSISDCGITAGKVILNMSLKDEELNTFVNVTSPNIATIELDLTISSWINSSQTWQFSKKWLQNQSVAVCVPNELLNSTSYKIDFTIGFDATNHVREFYYLDNGTLDNTVYFNSYTDNTVDLMDLLTADSTTFLFTFTDTDGLEVDDAIVHTYRKYIGEGIFREIERSMQDNNGQTHVHLVEEDVIYYFMVSQYGDIIYTSDTYNAKCLSTPCEITLSASPTETNWSIIDNQGGKYIITADRNTRIATLVFDISNSSLVNMSLYKYNGANATLLNSTSLTAMAGSIPLHVPLAYGNSTFFAVVYRDNELIKSQWIDLTDRGIDYFGTFGAVLGGLIVLSMMLMAVSEGAGFIIFTVLGLIVVSVMMLVDLSWMALISIICAGGIILWKLVNRGRKQG